MAGVVIRNTISSVCLPYVLYFVRQMLLLCLVSQGKLTIVILVLINEKNVETHIVSKPGGLNPLQGLDVGVASPEALKHNDGNVI